MLTAGSNLLYKCRLSVHTKRLMSESNVSQILSDLLGMESNEAKHFIEKYKFMYKEPHLLAQSIKFCQSLGYNNRDILDAPQLLTRHPLALENNYLAMKEGGFHSIEPKVLARSIFYMRRVVSFLKNNGIINQDCDVALSLVEHIQDKEIARKIYKKYSDNNVWNQTHLSLLQAFLKWRLGATEDEILTLFRIHKMIKNKSFRVIQENIAIAEELGFEPRKLLKYGYLLNNYPNYTRTILRDFDNIAGADMRKAMKSYPKLIMTCPTNIVKIYGILKEFNISDEIIRNRMNVFHMSPETVKLRLEEIERDPNLRVLLHHPSVLKLIVHHNRAKSRLSFLQQLQLRCASLVVLGADMQSKFEDYVREGRDLNTVSDLLSFLKKNFRLDHMKLKNRLRRHPYFLQVPLKDMEETYQYLLDSKFSESDIYKSIHIVLYPVEKIENAMKELKRKQMPNFNYKVTSPVTKLKLILYMIEKDYHFTGNGIWRNCDIKKNPEKC